MTFRVHCCPFSSPIGNFPSLRIAFPRALSLRAELYATYFPSVDSMLKLNLPSINKLATKRLLERSCSSNCSGVGNQCYSHSCDGVGLVLRNLNSFTYICGFCSVPQMDPEPLCEATFSFRLRARMFVSHLRRSRVTAVRLSMSAPRQLLDRRSSSIRSSSVTSQDAASVRSSNYPFRHFPISPDVMQWIQRGVSLALANWMRWDVELM